MRIRQPTQLCLELGPLDAFEIGDFPDDLVVEHVARGTGPLHLGGELLDAQLQLALALAAGLLVVDAADVFDLGADEGAGARGRVARLEGVALRGGLVEVLGELFVVELLLLPRAEEVLEREGVGLHVAQGAEVVLVGDVAQGVQVRGGVLDGGGEGVDLGLDAGLEGDELLELLREVLEVRFEIGLAADDAGDNLFNVAQVLVELVALVFDFDEAPVWLVQLGEGVDEGVCEVVKDAARVAGVGGEAGAGAAAAHGRVPVGALEEAVQDGCPAEDGVQ